ncbi:1-deoxy-D-xylulose-5-phosphate synthase [Planctomycetota bacterium]
MRPLDDKYILKHIDSPQDMKQVPVDRLDDLAVEIRRRIIEVCYKNGGHLATNLGAVELSIALHYVFDLAKDTLVFDVGHQVYTHKILTGRNRQLDTLRQFKGLMGFPNPKESEFDPFCTGHAGTSISTAWGLQLAEDILQTGKRTIAFIGDGSIASGLPFEALFHIGNAGRNQLIILNDNDMSIAQSVGSLHNYLNKVRLGQFYREIKKDFKYVLDKVPMGSSLRKSISYLQDCVRNLITPGQVFEELGLKYYGPVDGHNIFKLVEILRQVKDIEGPVLLHALTEKGKGLPEAEANPRNYHGISPPETDPHNAGSSRPSWTSVFADELVNIAGKDPKIIAITAGMPDGTGVNKFEETFPERIFDVGICEQHAVAMAAGMAKGGLKPFTAIYSTFLQRAFDQVHQELCLQNLPVRLALDRAGLVGDDGPTHHGLFDLSYLRIFPNMKICAPKDEEEFRAMLRFLADYDEGPIAIRYPRGIVPDPISDCSPVELGKGEILLKGSDVTILAIGTTVSHAVQAAKQLAEEDIFPTVFNAKWVKPLDENAIIELVREHPAVIIVEDNARAGGFGSAVLEMLNDHSINTQHIRLLAHPDQYIEHGTIPELFRLSGIDTEGIMQTAREAYREKSCSYS